MNGLKISVLFFILFSCNDSISKKFCAKVIKIKDGDTIELLDETNEKITIRLSDIDCPEKEQPYGDSAMIYTSEVCLKKNVIVINNGTYDKYNRLIGTILIDNKSLNQELILHGLAFHCKEYSKNIEYRKNEEYAKKNKKGLWSAKNIIAPWDWRKNN